jgi:VanZ family protein
VPNVPSLGKSNHILIAPPCRIRLSFAVLKLQAFLKYWLPPFAWMALIFSASSDTSSFEHSSRIIAPLLRWLFPHLSEDTVHLIVLLARKGAHLTEYTVLALLLWRALRKPVKNDSRPWNWREARLALLMVAFYAASDEFHQLFVATRDATVRDVLIDTVGGAAGLLALWFLGFHWKRPQQTPS